MTRRAPVYPTDTWPPRMNADLAAGYVGEKHVEDFLERVGTIYPEPRWVETTRRKFWYRLDLDRALGIAERPTGMGGRFGAAIREKRDG
jgi:hypothetical protein